MVRTWLILTVFALTFIFLNQGILNTQNECNFLGELDGKVLTDLEKCCQHSETVSCFSGNLDDLQEFITADPDYVIFGKTHNEFTDFILSIPNYIDSTLPSYSR